MQPRGDHARMRPDLKWDDVRLFLAAMRERTLAGAAARLGIDASTVSRRLAAFEATVGTALFDRTRDGLSPTAAAEQLVLSAEDMEAAAFRLSRSADGWEAAAEGVVRITSFAGLAESFVVPALPQLAARYPKIRFDLDISAALADLSRREADIALRLAKPTSGELLVTKIMTLPYALLAHASAVPPVLPADLSELRWIGWMIQNNVTQWLARHAPGATPVLRTQSVEAQIAAVEAGLGVALLPRFYTRLRGFVEIPLSPTFPAAAEGLPQVPVWLVGHRALRGVPRIAAVWSHLVEEGKKVAEL